MKNRKVGYLSAAPRVSTRPEAELGGPRSHVLGVINAFEQLGWEVKSFIVGDLVPLEWVAKGSLENLQQGKFRLLLADTARVVMGMLNAFRARRNIGLDVAFVYERFAAFQSLGWIFQRHEIPWILETNAPLFLESKYDRETMFLSSLAKFLEVRAYKKCDRLVCISHSLREIIVDQIDIPTEKIIVIPNGVDTGFFDPSLYSLKPSAAPFTIGFVGSLIHWQGLDILLDVLKELSHTGVDLCAVLVGEGPAKPELEEKTRKLDLNDKVHFVGYVSRKEIPSYIASFDVGFSGQVPLKVGKMYLSPLKLYEYMAMAKPVIASDFEDARRVVEDHKTGFLFEAGKPEALREAILAAYRNRNRLPCMGADARSMVVRNHSWETRMLRLLNTIEID